jgi:5-methylcytosine-specific restriction endonuclease McrBC GTP-binding regulatory subunit McrB
MMIEYKNILGLYLLFCIIVFFVFKRIINNEAVETKDNTFKRITLFVFILIFVILNVRGKVSGKPFSIPSNLYIIGTMNTADRSIALMDVALRRRFSFEELMPEKRIISRVLEQKKTGSHFIELVEDIFETINSRIRFLYDQDHQLGHAYLLEAVDCESLRLIFVDRLIPLLQEYFYGAWDKICMVLGCPYDETGSPQRRGPIYEAGKYKQPIIEARVFAESDTLGFDHDEYEDRVDFKLASHFVRPGTDTRSLVSFFLGILNIDDQDEYLEYYWEYKF